MKIDKEYIIEFLKQRKDFLREKYGVTKISLFGSYARGEETEESDIDFLVEFDEADYHKLSGLYIYLEEIFQRKISLVNKHARIKEKFLKIISKDLVHVV